MKELGFSKALLSESELDGEEIEKAARRRRGGFERGRRRRLDDVDGELAVEVDGG